MTWVRTLAGQATGLEPKPGDFTHQYAATGEQSFYPNGINNDSTGSVVDGLYRSTDGGKAWAPIAGPWGISSATTAATAQMELAIASSQPDTLYVSIEKPLSNGVLLGLYRTDNAWAAAPSWIRVPLAADYCDTGTAADGTLTTGQGKCGYAHVISVDPSDPNTLFAGGVDLWRCANCATSPKWADLDSGVGSTRGDYHVLQWSGKNLFAGSDHTLASSADGGTTWRGYNSGLSLSTFYSAVLHPTNQLAILAGLRDVNGVMLSTAVKAWSLTRGLQAVELGEAEVAMSSAHPDTDWMAAFIWGVVGRTMDGGQTFVAAECRSGSRLCLKASIRSPCR